MYMVPGLGSVHLHTATCSSEALDCHAPVPGKDLSVPFGGRFRHGISVLGPVRFGRVCVLSLLEGGPQGVQFTSTSEPHVPTTCVLFPCFARGSRGLAVMGRVHQGTRIVSFTQSLEDRGVMVRMAETEVKTLPAGVNGRRRYRYPYMILQYLTCDLWIFMVFAVHVTIYLIDMTCLINPYSISCSV